MTDNNFYFIELVRMPDSFLKSGYEDLSYKSYLIQAWKDASSLNKAMNLCIESDVVLFGGSEALSYLVLRAKSGKLSFEVSERWLKRGLLNLLSPRLLINMWYYQTLFKFKPVYKLCSSSFAARDQYILHSYKQRCYKWGYFTKVENREAEFANKNVTSLESVLHIMWCGRFLKWKHPELPIKLAARLKVKGYRFIINMFGSGEELDRCFKFNTTKL